MKKTISILSLLVVAFAITGCVHKTGFHVWKVAGTVNSNCHEWKDVSCTADLDGNPVSSECTLGFFTVGSSVGLEDQDEWVDVDVNVGPNPATE